VVTIRQFVGAVLEQVTNARVQADLASLRVANQYLQHDFLKGFGVPGMHVKDVELELAFAVAPGWKPASAFDDEDVRTNAVNRLEQLVHDLPAHPELQPWFERDAQLARRWAAGIPALRERFERALTAGHDGPDLVRALSVVIENHFFAAARDLRELLSLVTRPFTHRAAPSRTAVVQHVEDGVRSIVGAVSGPGADPAAQPPSPEIQMLIGKDELDRVPESKLHRMRLKLSASDRKWVVSQVDGEKVHTLSR
jgi:hypothetical protein